MTTEDSTTPVQPAQDGNAQWLRQVKIVRLRDAYDALKQVVDEAPDLEDEVGSFALHNVEQGILRLEATTEQTEGIVDDGFTHDPAEIARERKRERAIVNALSNILAAADPELRDQLSEASAAWGDSGVNEPVENSLLKDCLLAVVTTAGRLKAADVFYKND